MAENRFQKYAQPAQGAVFQTNPNAAVEQAREDERLRNERERLRITQDNAARDAANDAITREEKAQKLAQAEEEKVRLERAQGAGIADSLYQMRNVIAAAQEAKNKSNDWFATGIGAQTAAGFGGTSASDVEALLNTIGSNTAFDRLQKMREESPTGGALGAVSEIELRLLRDSIASLSQSQSDAQFQRNMDKVIASYTRVAGKLAAADSYYRQNGSMDGFTPPSEEELASFSLDGNPPPTAAGQGATQTSLELPQEYQDRHAAYLRDNWGNITPDGYAQFRAGLDNQFSDVASPNIEAYREFAPVFNQMAAEGQPPEAAGQVPPAVRDLSGGEQAVNDFVTSPFGTGATSAINSATFGIPDALAGRRLQAAQELNPKSAFAGDFLGGAVGSALGGTGLAAAGVGRAAPFLGDALYGTTYGALSDEDPVTGALIGLGSSIVGDQVGKYAGRGINSLRAPKNALSEGQQAITQTVRQADNQDAIAQALTQARDLGVPMTLADASPELQSLAGSAVRFSPTTAGTARSVMATRNQGQIDRLAEAVARDLGPVENIPQRSADLMQQARTNAGPLYDYAYASPGAADVNIMDLMDRPTFKAAMKEAYREAADEGVDPRIMGFVMDDAGEVSINPDAFGGYSRATVNAERNILQPRTVRAYGGREVVKQGPLDLVGWLRTQGGLRDSGGELSSMGLTNQGRGKSAELVGRETEFGPLVNPQDGMTFDDAALAAWEAGYFPELSDRPDINTFLNAMRDTAEGISQRFKVDDLPEVEAYRAARSSNNEIRSANGLDGGLWEDTSVPAGMREAAPAEAYGSEQMVGMDWQGLDYIKRGLDNVIEKNTDKINGANSDARRAAIMKNTLVSRMDEINPDYAAARQAYAGPAQERGFLQRGVEAYNTRPDQLGVDTANLTPEQRQQMQLGFQSEVMGRAGNLRGNTNPWGQLNTPNMEGRMGALYGEDADIARLLTQRDLELQLAGSANRLIGNSATAEREIADEFFKKRNGMGGDVAMGIVETGALGGPWLTVGKSIADRVFKDKREAAAAAANRSLADDLGPLLLDQNPQGAVDSLSSMMAQDAEYRAIVEALTNQGDKWGRRVGTGLSTAAADRIAY